MVLAFFAAMSYFYPRPLRGGRLSRGSVRRRPEHFYPRPLRGGRHGVPPEEVEAIRISIHALCEEGDGDRPVSAAVPFYFYPRPLRGGRQRRRGSKMTFTEFLSTPSARRATAAVDVVGHIDIISIHALCEEGDPFSPAGFCTHRDFYPRPLRGGRPSGMIIRTSRDLFLSTPSARRATAKTETKSLFSNKLYNILHEFRRALIYNGSKSYPNHAK